MKNFSVIITSIILSFSIAACSSQANNDKFTDFSTTESVVDTNIDVDSEILSETADELSNESFSVSAQTDPKIKKILDEYVDDYSFEGVMYAEKEGKTIALSATGILENGSDITFDTPMPIGSVSKQFCAAAVLLLNEQGKLDIDDTIDKYFPEYSNGEKITVKNLLSMRSGIPEMTSEDNSALVSIDRTEEENSKSIKKWIFAAPLDFTPDSQFEYVNSNYFLLADIVEQVSGEKYVDFLCKSFFSPLGMVHTGTIGELSKSPAWADGIDYQQVDREPGLTNGCGDIISNAPDMSIWIKALSEGTVISEESYKAMTTSYSDEQYGFGMYTDIRGGVGHYGSIGIYSAFDYINEEHNFVMIVFSDSIYPPEITPFTNDLIDDLME